MLHSWLWHAPVGMLFLNEFGYAILMKILLYFSFLYVHLLRPQIVFLPKNDVIDLFATNQS